jgi:acetyltransferase-like isoleucine patch superfamily enzyme
MSASATPGAGPPPRGPTSRDRRRMPHERLGVHFELLRIHLQRRLFMLVSNQTRVRWLRQQGMKIGEGCAILTPYFSTEPYLIELGDHVAISAGTEFITHDAVGWVFPDRTDLGLYGRIRVGSNTFIGLNALILPNTIIGSNCVIGAGSVVRGNVADDSVVFGNPAEFVMKTSLMKQLVLHSKGRLDTFGTTSRDRKEMLLRHFGLR